MIDFKLNADGDIALSGGYSADTVTAGDLVAQRIRCRLKTFRGEWFADTSFGVPYFDQILGKGNSIKSIRAVFAAEIAKVPGVVSLSRIDIAFDRQSRELSLLIRVLGDSGEIVTGFNL